MKAADIRYRDQLYKIDGYGFGVVLCHAWGRSVEVQIQYDYDGRPNNRPEILVVGTAFIFPTTWTPPSQASVVDAIVADLDMMIDGPPEVILVGDWCH